MPEPRWYRRVLTRRPWGAQLLMIALLIVLGRDTVTDAVDDPSSWNVSIATVWIFAVVVYATTTVYEWRTRHRPEPEKWTGPLDVFANDAAHAVATTATRIDAIKTLRQRNPGLGLRDAAELIDTALAAPDPPTI